MTRARRRLGVLACAAAATIAVAGCGATTGPQQAKLSAQHGPAPVVIPVAVHWLRVGARPVIKVRIGNNRPIPVLLDTGSVGLRVYAPAIRLGRHSGITLTARRQSATFADGTFESGVTGNARVEVGSLKTARSVPFALVSHIGCRSDIPDCPGAAGMRGFTSAGEYGILGVGLRRNPEGIPNPLLSLPRAYARSWSIELTESGGSLVLRPQVSGPAIAQLPLRPDRKGARGGARTWRDDQAKVCWAEVDLRGTACEPTLFDTGSTTMIWYGGLLGHSDTSIDRVLVNPGEYVAAWQPGSASPFWTFTSGSEFSHDSVIALRGGHPLVIVDVQAFLQFSIAYDDTRGRIALYPQTVP